MPCVHAVPDIAAPGIQNDYKVKYTMKKSPFNTRLNATHIGVERDNKAPPVSSMSSYKEGRYFIPHDKDPFALVCAIKRARQSHESLANELQDGVVCWACKLPDGDDRFEHPVRLDCNSPLQDVEGKHWRASRGMISGW